MDLTSLFADYYVQYRGESNTPPTTDPEYSIFISLAREAIARWASYDNTYWKELFVHFTDSTQTVPTLVKTIQAGVTAYAAPTDMKEVGGYLRILDALGNTVRRYPVVEPQDAQFRGDNFYYCYFTGDPQSGFKMHLNPTPDTSIYGLAFDYIYYKLPTFWTAASASTATTEMTEPMFIVHRALANRFRASRNPYYQSAKNDGEDVLKIMQMNNNSGNWANPWQLEDHTGTVFGQERGGW